MTPAKASHDLAVTAIDLTRACTECELYLRWLQLHASALHGSAGIANYLFLAASAFEERARPQVSSRFDPFIARENLADLLMASAPLSSEELRAAVSLAIREATEDDPCPSEDARYGAIWPVRIPATHPKFEAEREV